MERGIGDSELNVPTLVASSARPRRNAIRFGHIGVLRMANLAIAKCLNVEDALAMTSILTMTSVAFAEHLAALRLSPAEAAQLLSVSERSVRRWTEGEEVPGTVAAAMRAWRNLDDHHLAWKPDAVSIFSEDQEQIRRIRDHSGQLSALLTEVAEQGGPATPWSVDIAKRRARCGHAEVGFYLLQNGSFSPSTYRRLDRHAEGADPADARDASYCIAQAFSKARAANRALSAVASWTKENAKYAVRSGATLLTRQEVGRRTAQIIDIADRIETLAEVALEAEVTYRQFEVLMEELRRSGFFPQSALVSEVGRSLLREPTFEAMIAELSGEREVAAG